MYRINVLLSCGHITFVEIQHALFVPMIGDVYLCDRCNREVNIEKVDYPIKQEEKPTA